MKGHNSTVFPLVVVGFLACQGAIHSAELIANGGFESNFTSWTFADLIGSDGTFSVQTGTVSPIWGTIVPAPPQGTNAAMSDAGAPGSHVLYQDIVVPAGIISATLTFSLYLNNQADQYAVPSPASLDFGIAELNQQARVDILTNGSDPFSAAAGDLLFNAYQSSVGDPLVSGYTTINQDLTSLLQAHPGETLRLRFAAVDNLNTLNLGVDAVSLTTQVPEASAFIPCAAALGGMIWIRRRLAQKTGTPSA